MSELIDLLMHTETLDRIMTSGTSENKLSKIILGTVIIIQNIAWFILLVILPFHLISILIKVSKFLDKHIRG